MHGVDLDLEVKSTPLWEPLSEFAIVEALPAKDSTNVILVDDDSNDDEEVEIPLLQSPNSGVRVVSEVESEVAPDTGCERIGLMDRL